MKRQVEVTFRLLRHRRRGLFVHLNDVIEALDKGDPDEVQRVLEGLRAEH